MWKENTLQLKEREEQIIKQSNLLIQQYTQFNSKSHLFRHPCSVYFQNQPLIQEFNQFGNVTDKRMCNLEIKVKAKTFRNVTIEWHNTEQENNEDLISGDEFLIQYMSNSTQMKDENKEEKWDEIKVKKKKEKDETWEYCIKNLQSNTTYAIRIKPLHSSFTDYFTAFSDALTCQTEPCPWSLLRFSVDRINDVKNVLLKNNNTLVQHNGSEDDFVSVSLDKSNEVSSGIHCWRIKMSSHTQIGAILLAVVNSNKSFTNRSFYKTDMWGIDSENPESKKTKATWKWKEEKEYTVDMYLNIGNEKERESKNKELKWKQVTEDGNGEEYTLKDPTTFNKYHSLSLVPHFILFRKDTTLQVMKISPQMYGVQLSRTEASFR